MKILIVDDSSTMRRIIINIVNRLEISDDMHEASSGKEGLAMLLDPGGFELVIIDWGMPEMSGVEFIRAVRRTDAIKDTPLLLVTTNAARDSTVEALRAGANNYVTKPFSAETMKERIDAVMQQAQA